MKRVLKFLVIISFLLGVLGACSWQQLAVDSVAGMLGSEESLVFLGEDDPDLVGEALPFGLKLYESLLEQSPKNPSLLLTTAKAFALYAFGYVQFKAEMETDDYKEQEYLLKRAKKLFLRGRHYIFQALDLRYPGFSNSVFDPQNISLIGDIKNQDLPYLYWGASCWLGAFSTDSFDMEMLLSLKIPLIMLERCLEINPSYDSGGIFDILISYYGSLPVEMGGSEEKARESFKSSIEISKGYKAAPYMNLALTVCISRQYYDEFKSLLQKVLDLDLEKSPENRLLNRLAQKKAAWYLEHLEDFFLLPLEGDKPWNNEIDE
ncbi:MAG: TRAP transporter TatT component family protein [Spirochaetales bacterium]|nr:TRAP transporter TatT component family protein [Spirochaetales bacterium]